MVDGIWMTPSRPEPPSPSGPLTSDVFTPDRGRAVSRPSFPSADLVNAAHASPRATDASAHPVVMAKRRRVIEVSTRFMAYGLRC